jgi:hypothetical protein
MHGIYNTTNFWIVTTILYLFFNTKLACCAYEPLLNSWTNNWLLIKNDSKFNLGVFTSLRGGFNT